MAKRKTFTSTEVKNRWNKKTYDGIQLRVYKGGREVLHAIAEEKGYSLNAYLQHLVIADNPEYPDLSGIIGGGGELSAHDFLIHFINRVRQ